MAKKAKILIVDRDKMLVDLLLRALSTPELSVLGATTAEEGARVLELHAPDLLVIDLGIAEGLPLVSAARSAPVNPKIIAIAGEGGPEQPQMLGAEKTVDRSAGLDALIAAIRESLDTDLPVLQPQNGISVLIVDDEEAIRIVLSEFLQGNNYKISTAKNGREAVQRVESDPSLQIVLLDVSMPEMGGMEALRLIMSQEPHPNVIMMTAVADREIARQAMKIGAFDYIVKPFNFSAIESSITACMSHSEYQKQPWWKRLTRR